MALILDNPNSAGPFSTWQVKDPQTKVIKLTYANFTTGNTDALVARLPADASILSVHTWVRTALSGNSVASPTVALGTASGGTQIAAAFSVTNTAGVMQLVSPIVGACAVYAPPYTSEIDLYVRGGCSTGNPTAGEIDLIVTYIR